MPSPEPMTPEVAMRLEAQVLRRAAEAVGSLPPDWPRWRVLWHHRRLFATLAIVRVMQAVVGVFGFTIRHR